MGPQKPVPGLSRLPLYSGELHQLCLDALFYKLNFCLVVMEMSYCYFALNLGQKVINTEYSSICCHIVKAILSTVIVKCKFS